MWGREHTKEVNMKCLYLWIRTNGLMLSACLLLIMLCFQELRREVELMDARGTRGEGPRLVARAWLDPGFKTRLLQVSPWEQAAVGEQRIH